jgi:hypothetical protein
VSLGHGRPGLIDNLRTFSDLIDDSAADRRAYVEFFPGVATIAGQWVVNSGATYRYNGLIQFALGGVLLDVVGVDTSSGTLNRVETLAECVATAGTFYSGLNVGADPATVPHWDDATLWDAVGVTWDHATTVDVYVHLQGDANPNLGTVVPVLGLFLGTRGEVHPQLGTEKLTNGGFESLAGWSVMTAPGWDDGLTLWDGATLWDSSPSSSLDAVLFTGRGSTSSLSLGSGANTGYTSRYQDVPTVAGAIYRLSAYYRTDPAFSGNLSARLMVGDNTGATVLYADGRDGDANGFATLTPTNGEWRRFLFDIVAPTTTTRIQLRLTAAVSPGAGQVNFDGVSFKRIYRYVYFEPRLSSTSLPEVEVASQSIVFAGKTFGSGTITLINADAALEALLPQLLVANRRATVYVGGAFGDGQEIYRDDWRGAWPGLTQKMTRTDGVIQFDLEDARSRTPLKLPPNKVNRADFPNCSPNDDGLLRWMAFSSIYASMSWKPRRVSKAGDYGVYEIADCSFWPAGIAIGGIGPGGADPVLLFAGVSDALSNASPYTGTFGLTSLSVLPRIGPHYTYDAATARVTIIDDVKRYLTDASGTDLMGQAIFDFNIGGGALLTQVASGAIMSAIDLAGTLQDGMRAVSGAADINVTYSHVTHKFTVSKGAGTLNLLCNTGAHSGLLGWAILGFDKKLDKTSALSYTSDTATFSDCDKDHFIRVSAQGYKDDAAGSITGTPGHVIDRNAWVAKFILYAILGYPLSQIDASFSTAGAAETGQGVRAALGAIEVPVSEFFARLEAGAIGDLIVDGDAIWRWQQYSASTTPVQSFFDRDFLTFEDSRDPANVHQTVRVHYAQQPGNSTEQTLDVVDASVKVKHGRVDVLDVQTYLQGYLTTADVLLLAQRYGRLTTANPLVVRFTARGKLVNVLLGDKIKLTRARAGTSTGALVAATFRVIGIRHNFMTGVSTCTAVEDVAFL